jgi:metal-dependent amidase/aminoacylase/carboxypeptidase family protein
VTIRDDAAAIAADLTELRRAIHAEPEIGLDLPMTQHKVLEALNGLPLEITTGKRLSSVTAVLRGDDAVLADGSAMYAELALGRLATEPAVLPQ